MRDHEHEHHHEQSPVDVLFVTHLKVPQATGHDVSRQIWLELDGQTATIPKLRSLVLDRKTPATLPPIAPTPQPFLTTVLLQSYLQHRGFSFRNIPVLELGWEQVKSAVSSGVRLIALCTTWLPTHAAVAPFVREAASKLRSIAPNIPVIAGGIGVRKSMRVKALLEQGRTSLSRDEAARSYLLIDGPLDRDLDAIVVGDAGEVTLAAIADRIKAGREFRDLPNLALPLDGGYRFTEAVAQTTDIEEVIDWRPHAANMAGAELPIRAGIGCRYKCAFCDYIGLDDPRFRSVESLMAELQTLSSFPEPRRVYFTDDNFGITRKRLMSLARAIIAAGVKISWRAGLRADVINPEVAALLCESGCRECLLGIESGHPGMLVAMNKRLDLDKSLRAIELLDTEGIGTLSTLLVGFPGETSQTVDQTASFLSAYPSGQRAHACHRYYLFRFEPSPLAAVASPEKRAEFGLEGIGHSWKHHTMSSDEAANAIVRLFQQVRGPALVYPELIPADWNIAAVRRVMELRDELQRERLRGVDAAPDGLLSAVQDAERTARHS